MNIKNIIGILAGVVLVVGGGSIIMKSSSNSVLSDKNNTSAEGGINSSDSKPLDQVNKTSATNIKKESDDNDSENESDDDSSTKTTTITVKTTTTGTTSSGTTGSTGATSIPASYTLAQVATHGNATSCWTAINGTVYDLTPWISQHPGGERAILSICGIDGSSAYDNQHGGNNRANAELGTFKIGVLK